MKFHFAIHCLDCGFFRLPCTSCTSCTPCIPPYSIYECSLSENTTGSMHFPALSAALRAGGGPSNEPCVVSRYRRVELHNSWPKVAELMLRTSKYRQSCLNLFTEFHGCVTIFNLPCSKSSRMNGFRNIIFHTLGKCFGPRWKKSM